MCRSLQQQAIALEISVPELTHLEAELQQMQQQIESDPLGANEIGDNWVQCQNSGTHRRATCLESGNHRGTGKIDISKNQFRPLSKPLPVPGRGLKTPIPS
jgi:hypothetical protein